MTHQLSSHSLLLRSLAELLFLLLLEVFLLGLGVQGVQLGIALRLLRLVALEGPLLGLLLLDLLLEVLDQVLADVLELAQDLVAEVRRGRQVVRQADEVRQEGHEVLVGVRGREAVSEIKPLAGSRLIKTNE